MYSVSEKYSNAIVSDVRDMPYRVTLAGSIVLDQTRIPNMTLTESASGGSGVSIGTANSASLKLTLRDAEVVDYNDVLVEPESGLVLPDGSIEWIPLGKFWVTNSSTSNDYTTVTLNCADGMYLLSGEFISELTYPTTLKAFVNEIISKTGVTFVGFDALPHIILRVKPDAMTYRDAIGYAAGCCGKNARFNREGNLEFFWYTDSGITIERNTQYLNGMTRLNDKPLEVTFEVTGKQETYTVNIISDGNGGVTATPGRGILEDETVVLSVNPFHGYELAEISAVTENGMDVTLYKDADGGYTFIQPDSNVTVTAAFRSSTEGPFNLTVRAYDGGSIRASGEQYDEGSSPIVYVKSHSGYKLDKFVVTPASVSLSRLDVNANGETLYEFTMPSSDVTINAYFKEEDKYYTIERIVDQGGLPSTPGYVVIENHTTPGSNYKAGDVIFVMFARTQGHVFDYYEANVDMVEVGQDDYQFIMPDHDVSITAHFKQEGDDGKTDQYSWLALPAHNTPPTSKPYWAVFYKHITSVPTWQRFHLVWFDSWSVTGYDSDGYGKRLYGIKFNGYYHCGSKNTGYSPHAWDTSAWSGNGASGSTLEWDAIIGTQWASDPYYSGEYCLIASNIHLYYNSTLLFQMCPNAIQNSNKSYLIDGMDVRERGAFAYYKCPDTFSTPAPAANWMILKSNDSLLMDVDEDGEYSGYGSGCSGLCVVWFDDISVEKVGAVFSNSEEEFYIARVTNGHYCDLCRENGNWGSLRDIADNQVIGLRNPNISESTSYSLLGTYYFNGLLASSCNISSGGTLLKYKNDCKICDCVRKFYLRRSVSNTEKVTMTYTNPLIYEKSVPAISDLVQDVTYTPAKVKHRGNPAFQVGDIVTVPDKNGEYHTVLIMQQTMTFGGGMNSEITCPGQTEKEASFSANGPMTTQIKREVKQASEELEHRISANNALVFASLHRTIGNTEAKISSIVEWQTEAEATIASLEQTVSEHGAEIESHAAMLTDHSNTITNIQQEVDATRAEINLLAEFDGYADVRKVYTTDDIDTWNKNEIYYVESLKTYYVFGKQPTNVSANGATLNISSAAVTATPQGDVLCLTLDDRSSVTASNGTVEIKLSDLAKEPTWYATSRPLVNSIAAIRQQADANGASIGLIVESGEVKGSVLVEAINNDESKVVLTGDRLVVDSKNFKLDEDGELEISGKITAASGSIGGWNITNGRSLKDLHYFDEATGQGTGFQPPNSGAWAIAVGFTDYSNWGTARFRVNHYGVVYSSSQDGNYSRLSDGNIAFGVSDGIKASLGLKLFDTSRFFIQCASGMDLGSNGSNNVAYGSWQFAGTVYGSAGDIIFTSDKNAKNSITDLSEAYGTLFDDLRPVVYRYNNGTSNRLHTGFIAQEVYEAMKNAGLTSEEFACVCIDNKDGSESWGIRYAEIIPLCVKEIQKLKQEIKTLKGE